MTMGMGTWATRAVATVVVATDGTGDTTDIQTGINMLPAGGGVVYIREGTYTIVDTITIPNSNIALIGAGRATQIVGPTAYDWDLIYAEDVSGLLFDSIYFYGRGAGSPGNFGIEFDTVTNSFIRNCWMENCGGGGIYVDESDYAIIEANNINSNFGFGITVYTSEGCIVANNNVQDGTMGISIDTTTGSSITGNVCWSNGQSGIYLNKAHNCAVSGNNCTNAIRWGIQCVNTTGNTITGNIFQENDFSGIYIFANSHNNSITSNICQENLHHGITIHSSDDNTVVGNICIDNDRDDAATYDGIRIENDSDNTIISGNRCRDNDRYEINIVEADCNKTLVLGNICIGADHVGTINDAGTGTIIAHNIEA